MNRTLVTAFAALLGAAALVHADAVVYQTRDSGFATAPAPTFGRRGFHGPHVQTGVSVGFGARRVVRPGVTVSTGFSTSFGNRTTITTRRTIQTGGAYVHQSTVYPGVGYDRDYEREVGDRAEQDARRRLQQLKRQVEAAGGALLEGGIRPAQVRWDGFNVEAVSEVHATLLVPDGVLVQGTQVARGRLELQIPDSGATLPLAVSEAVRLLQNPEGEEHTLFGALLRRAWRDARGELTSTRGAKLRVISGTHAILVDMSSFDDALGRRGALKRAFGRNFDDLPQLSTRQVGLHVQAMQQAANAKAHGDARHYQALVAQRAGRFDGAKGGLRDGLNR
ncbi:MAG: hypothetical protein R3F62_22675 [Planctomycetota bacterium]